MMMAVQPKAGLVPGLDLNLTGTAEATAEGDAFMALMATLTATPEGEAADAAGVGAEEIAKQLAAMITGVVAPAKAGTTVQAAGETGETATEEAPDSESETSDATAVATPAVAIPGTAEPAKAAVAVTVTTTPVVSTPQTPTVEAQKVQTPAETPLPGAAAPQLKIEAGVTTPAGQAQALPAAVTAAGASETMPPQPTVFIAEGETASPAPQAGKDAVPAPVAMRTETPAPVQAALQSLIQLNAPGLSKAFAAQVSPVAKSEAAAPRSETKAGASSFLTSTILPLLPESLHAVVLGQNAPGEVAPLTEAPQSLDAAEQIIEQQLDLAHEGEWLDQLAKDIARSAGKEGGLRFRLHPEHLGSLHIEMTQGAAGASIRMTADTEAARAIIADAQPKLIAEARANGLKVAESHVDLGSNGGQQASADARKQEDLQQQQRFVRTAAAEKAEGSAPAARAEKAAERYA